MSSHHHHPRHLSTSSFSSNCREWAAIPSSTEQEEGKTFRVLDWNILAPGNVDYTRYREVPRSLLDWRYRRRQILKEILEHEPDLIALQEVDQGGYHGYLEPELKKKGYDGYFVVKSNSCNNEDHNKNNIDGVALLWRSNRFQLIEKNSVLFEVGGVMDRPQVGVLTVLKDLQQQEYLVVANTHLLFNSKRGDIKLGQLLLLTQALFDAFRRYSRMSIVPSKNLSLNQINLSNSPTVEVLNDTPGVLLIGDLNMTPTSHLYRWLRDGLFDFSNIDDEERKRLSGQYLMESNRYPLDPNGHNGCGATKPNEDVVTPLQQSKGVQSNNKSTPPWFVDVLKCVNSDLFRQPALHWIDNTLPSLSDSNDSTSESASSPESDPTVPTTHNDNNQQRDSKRLDLPSSSSSDQSSGSCLHNPFQYKSAYALLSTSSQVERDAYATAFHGWQKGCVDYIFASTNELQVSRLLQLPSLDNLRKLGNIPHKDWPGSDHFDLIADVKWTPKSSRRTAVLSRTLNDQVPTGSSSSPSKRSPTRKRPNASPSATHHHHHHQKRRFRSKPATSSNALP